MNGQKQCIWKYEAQHHWAVRHGCHVNRADIGHDPECPIPPQFEITAAEQYAMTGTHSMPELLGL